MCLFGMMASSGFMCKLSAHCAGYHQCEAQAVCNASQPTLSLLQITDAANEAKDNVKYLATLEKSLEPMYMGTPRTIQESLPTLINNIKMMHTIARYYNTSERMTVLFQKVTNQMVRNCKEQILAPGKLWDQDKVVLLDNLTAAVHLNEAYQEQYRLKRDRLQVRKTKLSGSSCLVGCL